jgi:hypothetical protein
MHPLLEDPWIAARIEAAVAPYAATLSAEELGWMKDQMAASLAEHDKAAKLLRRARPAVVDESGELRRDEVGPPAKVTPIRGKKKAG